MTKQEFLAISLPFHLKVLVDTSHWFEKREPFIAELEGVFNFESYTVKYLDKSGASYTDNGMRFKPILHPLSSLTKWIEHRGEKIIPLLELKWNRTINGFTKSNIDAAMLSLSLKDAINLIEWHFDIAGLIEKGEAIDVNTLKENPYK